MPEPVSDLMTTSQVAQLFRVDPKTVTRWSKAGLIPTQWTIGGHRRYPRKDVQELLVKGAQPPAPKV